MLAITRHLVKPSSVTGVGIAFDEVIAVAAVSAATARKHTYHE